jgi:hypothetical protein
MATKPSPFTNPVGGRVVPGPGARRFAEWGSGEFWRKVKECAQLEGLSAWEAEQVAAIVVKHATTLLARGCQQAAWERQFLRKS